MTGQRHLTNGQLFKPTLYKLYCEGPLLREPKNVSGPRRNRVLTKTKQLLICLKCIKYIYNIITRIFILTLISIFLKSQLINKQFHYVNFSL